MTVLLAGEGPDAIAELRFRTSVWFDGLDAYLEELYVAPALRGQGHRAGPAGRGDGCRARARADHIELTTSVDDTAAIGLYERVRIHEPRGRPGRPGR